MKALVLQEIKRLALTEVAVPAPGADEVLIRTMASTICTSDLNDIDHNPFGTVLPQIIGHEGAGIVAAVGSEVKGFAVGDRVTAHPVVPCMDCASCLRGLFHLCDEMDHLGITMGGTFAEHFLMRADRVRRIPEGMSFPVATLMEPVCVCLEAVERANVGEGSNVLVIGDGPFGVMIAKICAAKRPKRIVFVGRHEYRLGQVPTGGLYTALNEKKSEDIVADILNATEGEGIDSAILAVGNARAVEICIEALRSRGTLSVFSGIMGKVPVDLWKLHVKELHICGSCNDMDCLDEALVLLADESLGLSKLISHEFPFAQWEQAFDMAANGKDGALKVSVVMEEKP